MKSSAMFVSLLVPGESLCTGSDDLPTSVPFYYRDSDLEETVGMKTGSSATDGGIIDVTVGVASKVSPVLERHSPRVGRISQRTWATALTTFRPVPFNTARTVTRSTPQWSKPSLLSLQLCRPDVVHWKRRHTQGRREEQLAGSTCRMVPAVWPMTHQSQMRNSTCQCGTPTANAKRGKMCLHA